MSDIWRRWELKTVFNTVEICYGYSVELWRTLLSLLVFFFSYL